MILFFLFHIILTTQPLPVRQGQEAQMPEEYRQMLFIYFATIGFWLVLEIFEFLAWDYRWKDMRRGLAITLARYVPVCLLVSFLPRSIPGMLSLMAPLLTFYLTLVFRRVWSYLVVALFCVVQLVLFFSMHPGAESPRPNDSYSIAILLYQIMSVILMFLFAQFWKADRENRERQSALATELRSSHEELKRYASRLSHTVALEERTRIARDIHDNLGHTLVAISIQLNKAEAFFSKDPVVSKQAIGDARSSIQAAMVDIRSTLDTLTARDEGFNLFAQLQKPLASLRQMGIAVISDITGEMEGYNTAVLLALFRFVQEGVTNIIKHAEASTVRLTIRLDRDQAIAELNDDGKGFDPGTFHGDNSPGSGYGLSGLFDRIGLVRGSFSVDSAPGKGTKLKATLPRDPVSLIGKEY